MHPPLASQTEKCLAAVCSSPHGLAKLSHAELASTRSVAGDQEPVQPSAGTPPSNLGASEDLCLFLAIQKGKDRGLPGVNQGRYPCLTPGKPLFNPWLSAKNSARNPILTLLLILTKEIRYFRINISMFQKEPNS